MKKHALLAGCAAGVVALPWLVDAYTTALLARTLVIGLVAVSVAVLTGVAGLPTLGQTAPFAAGAYTCALLSLHTGAVGVVSLGVGAAAGALLAALTAPLVVHARGVVALMITLAVGELAVVAAGRWKPVTGGTDGLAVMPGVGGAGATAATRPFWGVGVLADDRARYLYALAVVAVVAGAVLLVLRTPAGRLLRACRDDEHRMRASGHPVTAYLAVAFVAAGAVAGVAGSLLVTVQQYVSPADFGFDVAALLLLGVVIGGAGSVGGAFAGTALVVAGRDWLSGLLPGHAPVLLGALFVLAAYAFPHGVAHPRRLTLPSGFAPPGRAAARGRPGAEAAPRPGGGPPAGRHPGRERQPSGARP